MIMSIHLFSSAIRITLLQAFYASEIHFLHRMQRAGRQIGVAVELIVSWPMVYLALSSVVVLFYSLHKTFFCFWGQHDKNTYSDAGAWPSASTKSAQNHHG